MKPQQPTAESTSVTEECRYCGGTGEIALSPMSYTKCPECTLGLPKRAVAGAEKNSNPNSERAMQSRRAAEQESCSNCPTLEAKVARLTTELAEARQYARDAYRKSDEANYVANRDFKFKGDQ